MCRQGGSSTIKGALDGLAEQPAGEFEPLRKQPDVEEIPHPAVGDAEHHHGLELFRHDGLTTIGAQVRSGKAQNRREHDVLWWRRDGVPEADVHLNLDSGLLQVGDESNPHTTVFEILADIIPLDALFGKAEAVRLNLDATNFTEYLFEPLDGTLTTPKQINVARGAIRPPAP